MQGGRPQSRHERRRSCPYIARCAAFGTAAGTCYEEPRGLVRPAFNGLWEAAPMLLQRRTILTIELKSPQCSTPWTPPR